MSVFAKAKEILNVSSAVTDDEDDGLADRDEIGSITSRRRARCLGTVSSTSSYTTAREGSRSSGLGGNQLPASSLGHVSRSRGL